MSAINFPDPSQSPWTNSSTGITYTYSNGVWKALSSEETFLKPADADLAYLKKNDGGAQQVISGGGGLNVDGDVQKKGNTVPSAVMGASAPSNPGICDFWTDTSGDDPVLKSWNGTEWVEVGSSTPSELAPVISNVTLTENDATGDRFTSQTFDVDITMLREGEPFSQKGLKGEVTASFEQRPSSEPVASNNAVAFPNTNRSSNQNSYSQNGYQYVPVWAPGFTEGSYEWYTYSFTNGTGSYGSFVTVDINNITIPKDYIINHNNSITNSGANRLKYGKYFPATHDGVSGDLKEYILIWQDASHDDKIFRAVRNRNTPNAQWSANWSNVRPPVHYEASNEYYWYSQYQVHRGKSYGSSEVSTVTQYTISNRGTGSVAIGNGIVLCTRANNQTQYVDRYDIGFTQGHLRGTVTVSSNYEEAKWIEFVNGYFWLSTTQGTLYRSYDGTSWSNVSIPRFGGVSGNIEVDYIDTDPNNPGTVRAWGMAWSNGNTGTNQRYILTSNNNGSTWVATWGAPKSGDYFNECIPLFGDGVVAFVDQGTDNGYNRMGCDYYPYSQQTVTLQGTGEGYSEFNVGDLVRKAGTTGYEFEGKITSISGSDIGLNSAYIYQAGDVIEAKYATSSGVASRYLVIETSGAITGTVGSDPGYVTMSPDTNQTLTFPATFASGDAPDDELPAGTTIKVSAQATNSIGSSEFGPSNVITPA